MTAEVHQLPAMGAEPDKGTESFIQHWIKARIDEPRDVMSRHDDAARQLIAVSGLLQGAYLAIFAFGEFREIGALRLVLLFLPLIAVVYCAATVLCAVPSDINVHGAFRALRSASAAPDPHEYLDASIKEWSEHIDSIATKKRRWLHAANLSFIAASAVTVMLIVATGMA